MTQRAPDETVQRRGFAPSARRRNRIAGGVALAALAVGGNLLVYSSLESTTPVVQAVVDVPAGIQITSEMLRTVDVDVDPSVNVIPGDDLLSVIGQYAKVRIVSGSLVSAQALQSSPLVEPGHAVVALEVKEGSLPVGLRERVGVQLVIPAAAATVGDVPEPIVIAGTVVALPITPPNAIGTQSLSVEVVSADAPSLAAADDVRVVLTEPTPPTEPPSAGED